VEFSRASINDPPHDPKAFLRGPFPHVAHHMILVKTPDRTDAIRDFIAEQPSDILLLIVETGAAADGGIEIKIAFDHCAAGAAHAARRRSSGCQAKVPGLYGAQAR